MIEPDIITRKREELAKKGKHPGCNLPAIARRDEAFVKNILTYPGYKMDSFDFVSLEPSVSAAWSNDPMYKYATCDGIGKRPFVSSDGTLMVDDLYLMFATQLNPEARDTILGTFDKYNFWDKWNDPEIDRESLSKHKDIKALRQFAKQSALGIERGMGYKKLHYDLQSAGYKDVTKAECKGVIKKFWEFFEDLRALERRLHAEVSAQGYFYTNPFGFKVNCEPHKAYAHFTQATASGVIEALVLKFFAVAPWAKFHCLIHDEFVFSYPENKEDEMLELVYACLDSLNQDLGWSVPMRLGRATGKTFADMK